MDSSTIGTPVFSATELRLAQQPAWLAALLDAWHGRAERFAQERKAQRTVQALSRLDARTLRDIGLDASELTSTALEAAERIEATRWHVWRPHRTRY
jgi:uncharacterized protein YjiS (DUF1127 family)